MKSNRLLILLAVIALLATAVFTTHTALTASTRVSDTTIVSPGSAHPPELYDSVQAPNLAGYWNVFWAAVLTTRGD